MTLTLTEIKALIRVIQEALGQPGIDEQKARRALALAEEAARLPICVKRDELVRDARQLLKQARGQS